MSVAIQPPRGQDVPLPVSLLAALLFLQTVAGFSIPDRIDSPSDSELFHEGLEPNIDIKHRVPESKRDTRLVFIFIEIQTGRKDDCCGLKQIRTRRRTSFCAVRTELHCNTEVFISPPTHNGSKGSPSVQ